MPQFIQYGAAQVKSNPCGIFIGMSIIACVAFLTDSWQILSADADSCIFYYNSYPLHTFVRSRCLIFLLLAGNIVPGMFAAAYADCDTALLCVFDGI